MTRGHYCRFGPEFLVAGQRARLALAIDVASRKGGDAGIEIGIDS